MHTSALNNTIKNQHSVSKYEKAKTKKYIPDILHAKQAMYNLIEEYKQHQSRPLKNNAKTLRIKDSSIASLRKFDSFATKTLRRKETQRVFGSLKILLNHRDIEIDHVHSMPPSIDYYLFKLRQTKNSKNRHQ